MTLDPSSVTHLFAIASGIHVKSKRIMERALRRSKLTYTQFGILAALSEQAGQTQRQLASLLDTDPTTVTVVCDSLEKKGLAERRPDSSDRRVRRIATTRKGQKVFARALDAVQKTYLPLTKEFDESELRAAMPMLTRLYFSLKEHEQ